MSIQQLVLEREELKNQQQAIKDSIVDVENNLKRTLIKKESLEFLTVNYSLLNSAYINRS